MVDFGERRMGRIGPGIESNQRGRAAEDSDGAPDRAIDGARAHGIEASCDALVPGGIERQVGFDMVVTPAVAIRVEHERRPPCAFAASPVSSSILVLIHPTTGPPPLVQRYHSHRSRTAGDGPKAGIDERVLHRLGIEDRKGPGRPLQRGQLRGRVVGALLQKAGLLGPRTVAAATVPVEHAIVVVGLGIQIFSSPQ